ncbi:MAG: hypothetical protein MJY71_01355 [Bacteroidaceae bacterium]|nr:hypothetical protein [Bacteroidaceae bacterium]
MKTIYYLFGVVFPILVSACTSIPRNSESVDEYPEIFPDNVNVTIPSNIAPLTFYYCQDAQDYITRFSCGETEIVVKGQDVSPSCNQWAKLIDGTDPISVDSYVKDGDKWYHYKQFQYFKAQEIDEYLSYRLIPPAYSNFNDLKLIIRNLTNFRERVFYDNMNLQTSENSQCVNCHTFRNYGTESMQIHVRQYLGGTIIFDKGKLRKVNLKCDSTISSGVYPAWHPTHDYIAYSTNITAQSYHTSDPNIIEVLDQASQLILYDLDRNTVSMVFNNPDYLACYPAWAPDGRRLYFTAAYLPYNAQETPDKTRYFYNHSTEIHYDLYYKDFDPATKRWGDAVKVIDAAGMNKSITLPRVSPDGRYLMFSMGNYGVFHLWHPESDLYVLDLSTGQYRNVEEINSDCAESYHNWSSNGNWVVISTRREDSGYTRLYLAHHNGDGTFDKPFALPTKNPRHSVFLMYSYNIPEFSIEDIPFTAKELSGIVKNMQSEFVPYGE